MGYKKFFVNGATRDESNLTELNATEAVNTGFMDHADWMAHVLRYALVMKHVKRFQGTSMLDVGCGRFPLLTYLWRNRVPMDGFVYTGLDMRAREAWLDNQILPDAANINLVQMNITKDNPGFIPEHEVVICTEVLEHIDKKEAPELLKRLFQWTKPGGTLFFSSPNLGGSDTVAENHTAPDGTAREWTYQGKRNLLERAGFEIMHAVGTFIRLDRLPKSFMTPEVELIKEVFPNSFFRMFAAAPFPAQANNAIFICKKPA